MTYYVYYSYEPFGRGYIGFRKCDGQPELDTNYLGSYSDPTFHPTEKIILETFETSELALQAEIDLHNFFDVGRNPHFANKVKQKTTGFTTEGSQFVSENNRRVQNELVENKQHHFQNPELRELGYELKRQRGNAGNCGKKTGSLSWWTNTETGKTTRSETCPGESWTRGRNYSPKGLLKFHQTEKGKQHNREKTLGTKWWNNGTLQKQSKDCPGEGWNLGRLPFKKK